MIVLNAEVQSLLAHLGVTSDLVNGGTRIVSSPITGGIIAHAHESTAQEADEEIAATQKAFENGRSVPAPRRGELVRLLSEVLRSEKKTLGRLVTLEVGSSGYEIWYGSSCGVACAIDR